MKKKIFVISAFVLLIGSFLILTLKADTMANPDINYPHLTITVYNDNGTQTVANARVKIYYGTTLKFSTLSNMSGVVDHDMTGQPTGTYTINAFEPDPPNDGRSGSNTVYFDGGNTQGSVNLNVFYE